MSPPRLDVANEDLVQSHVQAIWLAEAGLNLFIAACLGASIGLERQWRQHLAGLRTNTLVALELSGGVVTRAGDLEPDSHNKIGVIVHLTGNNHTVNLDAEPAARRRKLVLLLHRRMYVLAKRSNVTAGVSLFPPPC